MKLSRETHDQGRMNLVNTIGIALVILIVRLMGIATKTLSILNASPTVIAHLVLTVAQMAFVTKSTTIMDNVIHTMIVHLITTVPSTVFAIIYTIQGATRTAIVRLILIVDRMGTVTEDD